MCAPFTTVCNSSLTHTTYKPSHRSHTIIPLSNHHTIIILKSFELRNIYKRGRVARVARKKKWCVCLVLLFSPPSNLFVGFFKNLLFRKWRRLKIHQKNNSFSSAQCARHFFIEMKRELKMNTQNTCSGMYLCVHFQRYLFANVEDMGTKRERFSQKREVAFCCFLFLRVLTKKRETNF